MSYPRPLIYLTLVFGISLLSYKLKRTCFCRLAYLHEDLEPNVLHGCLKSSNILFDQQWNPKITDFGLAKLFDPEWSHLIMETLGSVSLPGELFMIVHFLEYQDT